MRNRALLPLTILAIVATGCGSQDIQQSPRSVPQRDLTLVTQTAGVNVASPVETQRLRLQHKTAGHARAAARIDSQRLGHTEPKPKLADEWVPAPVHVPPPPTVQPAASAAAPADRRELLPGQTVTLIPASGPLADTAGSDQLSAFQTHTRAGDRGGHCGGRGRGSGPAAPRPDFR